MPRLKFRKAVPGGLAEKARRRHAWLELIQTSGPFLTLPVVDRAFPDGAPAVADPVRTELRLRVAAMLADRGASRDQLIDAVLTRAFDWADHLCQGADLPAALAEPVPEASTIVRPEFAFYAESDN